MALTINPNMMAAGAAPSLDATHQSRTSVVQQLSPGPGSADAAGAGNMGLRQIIRAEIRPLGSADAQTPAADAGAAPDAQGAAGTNGTQAAPMAPERQTGAIVNIADNLAAATRSGLSALQGGSFRIPDLSPTTDVSSRLRDMGLSNDLSLESDVASRANEARVGTMIRHGQDMINSVARNAEMVTSLFKGTG